MIPALFCFGIGYTASELLRQRPDWIIAGTKRDPAIDRSASPPTPMIYAFDGSAPVTDFGEVADFVTHVLLSIPPGQAGDPVYMQMREQLIALPKLSWLGYLSTTGVYGNLDGEWATEETPCCPSGPRGERRVLAERNWLELYESAGLPVHIFRLPGIYGRDRNQMVSLRRGKAHRIVKPGHVFSRIHVEDLVRVLTASMLAPRPGAIYNVADDLAAPPEEVVSYAAKLLDMEPPPLQDFETADISPMARSFYADSKRIDNTLIKEELGVTLKYPTYKEGLDALFAAM
jgi:nucleoside-diphosphate-sugar epimerase